MIDLGLVDLYTYLQAIAAADGVKIFRKAPKQPYK
jgi:hypothetical protein